MPKLTIDGKEVEVEGHVQGDVNAADRIERFAPEQHRLPHQERQGARLPGECLQRRDFTVVVGK